MSDPQIAVHDDRDLSRYEVYVDRHLAGFAVYRLAPGQVVFVHTEIGDDYAGHGVGSALARAALDDVRTQHKRATPQCPFIAAYIRRHDGYADLVDTAHRYLVDGAS